MAEKIRVTSFNLENLFNRYEMLDTPWSGRDYEKLAQAVGLVSIASRAGDLASYETTDIQRNNTAEAILLNSPDVLAVMEVENIYSLRLFNHDYLSDYFDRVYLVDGNDPRGIDVGFLVRKGFKGKVLNIRTHVDDTKKNAKGSVIWGSRPNFGYLAENALFSRDCLEVDIDVGGKVLTFLVNHLKAQDGKASSNERRKEQAARVLELVQGAKTRGNCPIVLGDLNADIGAKSAAEKKAGATLVDLVAAKELADAFAGVADNWTHYYESDSAVSRLDYILVDKDLDVGNQKITRDGLSKKCKQYSGPRLPTVSYKGTEASDHCPISVEITV
jgi:endonuclease/exonuclease/phosphatase family metal-dependent hydrolase